MADILIVVMVDNQLDHYDRYFPTLLTQVKPNHTIPVEHPKILPCITIVYVSK